MMELTDIRNPFPGLRPFETDEYNLFFGREGQSDDLLARLQRTRFLAVVGTSGSGKSSLIRAGLLPALFGGLMGGAGSNWRIAILRPGHDPIGNLASALGEEGVLGAADQDSELQNTIIETTLRRSTLGLVDAAQQAHLSAHENLLIVVDQFEELFRFKEARKETGSEDDAAQFVKLLIEATAQVAVPIYVVPTMRSDFLGDCSQFAGLPEAINQGQYLIPRMSRDERRAAITGPVAVGGGEISLPLINRLLNDVGDNPDQLPILQHALMRTWDYCEAHRRNGEPIGLEHYEAIGTMAEALSRHADEAFAELPDERSRRIAEMMFKRLTEKGADNRETRRPTRLAEISAVAEVTNDEVVAVIDVFRHEGRSFLMPPAGFELTGETVIDISHESLIRNWERLKKWVDEEAQSARMYRRLADTAVFGNYLTGSLLDLALEWSAKPKANAAWAARYCPASEAEVPLGQVLTFIDASRNNRDEQADQQERQRLAEAERKQRETEHARLLAEERQRFAESEQLRAEEQAIAKQRELEQAQIIATRQRRFTFALALISLLALFAAGASVYAFSVARQREQEALSDKQALTQTLFEKEQVEKLRQEADRAKKEAEKLGAKKQLERDNAYAEALVQRTLAEKHLKEERAAKQGLVAALQKAERIKDAGRFFRSALADYDRSAGDEDEEDNLFRGKLEDSIKKFEAVKDYDGVAAAYIKIGDMGTRSNPNGDKLRIEFWPRAVENYHRSGNYTEAGQTLMSLGYIYARSTYWKHDEAAAMRLLGIEYYQKAYAEFSQSKPQDREEMGYALEEMAQGYQSLDGRQNKLLAIDKYEKLMALRTKRLFQSARILLAELYRETKPPDQAETLVDQLINTVHERGDLDDEASFLADLVAWGGKTPFASRFKYVDRARRIYAQKRQPEREAQLLLSIAHLITRDQSRKIRKGESPSVENDRKALEYYESAAAIYERMPGSEFAQAGLWAQLGELHQVMGRHREALTADERGITLYKGFKGDPDPVFDLYVNIINVHLKDREWALALATGQRLVEYCAEPGREGLAEQAQKNMNLIKEKIRAHASEVPPR